MGGRLFIVQQEWTVRKALERVQREIEKLKPGETLVLANKSGDPSFDAQFVALIENRFADAIDFVRTGSGRYRIVAKPQNGGCCGVCES